MVTDGAEPLVDGEEWATTRQDDAANPARHLTQGWDVLYDAPLHKLTDP